MALDWAPVGNLIKKCVRWLLLLVSGVWWVDLQFDLIKRGYVCEFALAAKIALSPAPLLWKD